MNWDKAKNLTIIFLLLLNVSLVGLVYGDSTKYLLTQEQEKAIFKVMKNNKIGLYATIPKEYPPMPSLQISPYTMDTAELVDIFFDNEKEVKKTLEGQDYKLEQGYATLTGDGYTITFENPKSSGAIELTKNNAIDLCNAFFDNHPQSFSNYVIDNINEKQLEMIMITEAITDDLSQNKTRYRVKQDGYKVEFRQKYKDALIYSNYVNFYVTDSGIVKIEAAFGKPVGFDPIKREIISADGGLFVFMQQAKDLYGDKEVIINKMDLVYHQQEAGEPLNAQSKLVPYYRFYIQGEDKPFLINGYTGDVYQ